LDLPIHFPLLQESAFLVQDQLILDEKAKFVKKSGVKNLL